LDRASALEGKQKNRAKIWRIYKSKIKGRRKYGEYIKEN
jgi:hypothetical protein